MELPDPCQMGQERPLDRLGQHRHPILPPFAVPDDDLPRRGIDVLHPQP